MTDQPNDHTFDVLVVGGGPAGAATGYWLAKAGHDVCIVERKLFPREKTCGDGLTPRAVAQLTDMGLADGLTKYHRYQGLRATAHGKTLELTWPSHPVYPSHGYIVRRRDLDQMVAEHAVAAGATLWQGAEALEPVVERGFVRGALVQRKDSKDVSTVRARYVVVADGANSRFGRALGIAARRSGPTARRSAGTGRARCTPNRGSSRRST